METEKIIAPSISGYDFNSQYYSLLETMTIKYNLGRIACFDVEGVGKNENERGSY